MKSLFLIKLNTCIKCLPLVRHSGEPSRLGPLVTCQRKFRAESLRWEGGWGEGGNHPQLEDEESYLKGGVSLLRSFVVFWGVFFF